MDSPLLSLNKPKCMSICSYSNVLILYSPTWRFRNSLFQKNKNLLVCKPLSNKPSTITKCATTKTETLIRLMEKEKLSHNNNNGSALVPLKNVKVDHHKRHDHHIHDHEHHILDHEHQKHHHKEKEEHRSHEDILLAHHHANEEEEGELEEDPRELREIWREIQGKNNWDGLLDPMNTHLRSEIIRYGEFAQSCYDSFDFDPNSKYCGSCKYPGSEFFEKMDMAHYGYRMCRYLYATSNINLPNFFQKSSIRSIWSQHANWMGFVAITSDEKEIKRLGRRDIVISWRGTVTYLEWIHDLKNMLRPCHFRDNPQIQVESGFYDLYTTQEEQCNYCSYSARQQVLAEVKRLIEKYKDEELSITVTGHSLGGALAMMTAYDIAEMRLNKILDKDRAVKKTIPVTVFSYASPRVGNLKFKERCEELGVKVLRVVNVHDKVPTVPGLFANEKNQYQKYLEDKMHFPWSYAHVGVELQVDHSHSPFLKPTKDVGYAHNLEAYLHLVDGYRGKGRKFKMATKRDIALVNKDSNFLKPEYGVPPHWRQDHNKGMVRNSEGHWVLPERQIVEPHPPDTAHHFALVLKMANDFIHDHMHDHDDHNNDHEHHREDGHDHQNVHAVHKHKHVHIHDHKLISDHDHNHVHFNDHVHNHGHKHHQDRVDVHHVDKSKILI